MIVILKPYKRAKKGQNFIQKYYFFRMKTVKNAAFMRFFTKA